ncbi:type VI secretion system protein ImpJ [Pseudoalteromonas citrea]|uniref:Type VI secretion system protein ImpJ n=2 Tax=Pseudoalteromonas citrea TaxID=43655 RepID=A0AAD4AHF9_9GAMM|nr:type VI secretion system baseplate subunit TssK [Pseudoalteromonas citrea]KAF7769679.1 type VI secretion system protein ImpJ [Pseudoalteromonas citrea]
MEEPLNKPVWAEGVLLAQQHFQLLDAYSEQQQTLRQTMLVPNGFGVYYIHIEKSALLRGVLNVTSLQVMLPNGRMLEYTTDVENQLKLTLDQKASSVLVHVAIAANRHVADIEGYSQSGQLSAYHSQYIDVIDTHDPNRSRELLVARPNILLLTQNDTLTYFDALPCLKLSRLDDGTFALDEQYIPPLLNVGASDYLSGLLKRTTNLVNAKVNVLLNRRKGYGAVSDFGPNEMNSFLLLNSMAPAASMLEHLQSLNVLHPERLYSELVMLISRVSVFEHSELATGLPVYNHNALSEVFSKLDEILRTLLDGVVPKRMAALKLERSSNAIYEINSIDSEMLQSHDFYLAVFCESASTQWIELFAEQVKIAASQVLEMMIASALNGVALTHCQRPPNKLAIKSGYEYFRLETFGDAWQQICEDHALSLFIPFSLQAATVEIVTVAK